MANRKPNLNRNKEMIDCACGCAQSFNKFDERNRVRKFIQNHTKVKHDRQFKKGEHNGVEFKKGQVPWNKNMTGYKGQEKHYNWKGGKPKCIKCRKQLGNYQAQRCHSCENGNREPEIYAKALRRREMSTLEQKFLKIIQKYDLPYKFVGNGEFMIERKNPDFININGEKKAIEVFSIRHKNQFRDGGLEGWKQSRSQLFAKYGWQVIFFEALEINENNVLKVLKGGQ